MLYLVEQVVVYALCVAEYDGFVVYAEDACGEGVEDFVDGAYASGECHDDVSPVDELLFALAHGVDGDEVVWLGALAAHVEYVAGDDAEYFASGLSGGSGYDFHESSAGSSVYEAVVVVSYPVAEELGFGLEYGVGGIGG